MAWFRCGGPSGGGIDQIATIALGQEFDYFELETETDTIPQYIFHGSLIRDVESTDVITIGDRAFEACSNVRRINLPNCRTIGQYAFACNRTTYASLISINLPNVETIGAYAFNGFYGSDATAELTFPACTYVGTYAFQHSSNNMLRVKSITLNAVTQMGSSAFVRVIADEITIGADCTSLGSTPFANANVTDLIILADTPPTLGTSAGLGNNASISNIYVPDSAVATYQSANRWSQYAAIIKSINNRP